MGRRRTRGKAFSSANRRNAQLALKSAVQPNRWTAAILLSIIIGTPLAILPGRFDTYDTTPKLTLLFLSSALLLWVPGRWWPGVVGVWRSSVGRVFYSLLILGAASLLCSSAFSGDTWLSFAGTVWRRLGAINQALLFFVAFVVAGCVYLQRSVVSILMLGMEAAGVVAGIYAILQYAGWDPLIPSSLYTFGSTPAVVRPPATLSQATFFATFLLPAILIAVNFRLHETASPWKRVHEIAFLLSGIALGLSGTRSALLGLAAGACVFTYVYKARVANWRTLMRAGSWALALAALGTVFLFQPAGGSIRARLAQMMADRTGGPRLLVWRDSLPLLWQNPVLGIGPELFEAKFRRVESLQLARAFPDHFHESPHNFFLEAAISQGIIGFVFWLSLLALVCWCGVRCCKQGDAETAVPLSASLLAMLISLQFCPLTIPNELYLLALSATLVGLAALREKPEARSVVLSPVLIGFARAFSFALVFIASAYMAQTTLYALDESCATEGDLAGVEHWYGSAHAWPMPGPNLAVSQRIASHVQRFSPTDREQALAAAKKASTAAELGSAERFNALYQSAMLALMSRDLPLAEAKLHAAVDASPRWYRPRMALSSVLWWEGRNQEAEREATQALDCAGQLKPYVKRTLDSARAQASLAPARPSL